MASITSVTIMAALLGFLRARADPVCRDHGVGNGLRRLAHHPHHGVRRMVKLQPVHGLLRSLGL